MKQHDENIFIFNSSISIDLLFRQHKEQIKLKNNAYYWLIRESSNGKGLTIEAIKFTTAGIEAPVKYFFSLRNDVWLEPNMDDDEEKLLLANDRLNSDQLPKHLVASLYQAIENIGLWKGYQIFPMKSEEFTTKPALAEYKCKWIPPLSQDQKKAQDFFLKLKNNIAGTLSELSFSAVETLTINHGLSLPQRLQASHGQRFFYNSPVIAIEDISYSRHDISLMTGSTYDLPIAERACPYSKSSEFLFPDRTLLRIIVVLLDIQGPLHYLTNLTTINEQLLIDDYGQFIINPFTKDNGYACDYSSIERINDIKKVVPFKYIKNKNLEEFIKVWSDLYDDLKTKLTPLINQVTTNKYTLSIENNPDGSYQLRTSRKAFAGNPNNNNDNDNRKVFEKTISDFYIYKLPPDKCNQILRAYTELKLKPKESDTCWLVRESLKPYSLIVAFTVYKETTGWQEIEELQVHCSPTKGWIAEDDNYTSKEKEVLGDLEESFESNVHSFYMALKNVILDQENLSLNPDNIITPHCLQKTTTPSIDPLGSNVGEKKVFELQGNTKLSSGENSELGTDDKFNAVIVEPKQISIRKRKLSDAMTLSASTTTLINNLLGGVTNDNNNNNNNNIHSNNSTQCDNETVKVNKIFESTNSKASHSSSLPASIVTYSRRRVKNTGGSEDEISQVNNQQRK